MEEQQPVSTEQQPEPAAAEPGMSKRQAKRRAKQERKQQLKAEKKAQSKEAKAAVLAAKRQSINDMLAGMDEAQQAAWREAQAAKKQTIQAQRAAAKARHAQALAAPQRVAIDLAFEGLMTEGELKSLCQQLSYSYSACVNGEQQMHLHLLGAAGDVEAALEKQLTGHAHWSATRSEQPLAEFFKDSLDQLVYLTADSPHELEALDSSKVYVIGGIVDRNRHKGICFDRAQAAGIATARLPIASSGVKLATSAVITVNQVVDILCRMQAPGADWRGVLEQVLPCRKRGEGAAAAGARAEAAAAGGGAAAAPAAGASAAEAAHAAAAADDAGAAAAAAGAGSGGQSGGEAAAAPGSEA